MKQESRLVAELYRYLAPFIDTDKKHYLSLDGVAAKKGVREMEFLDSDIPDMWFHLINSDSKNPILLEAKIIRAKKVTVGKNQIRAWKPDGPGKHKPAAWVAANETFDEFSYWDHEQFNETLNSIRSDKDEKCTPPHGSIKFDTVAKLALHILQTSGKLEGEGFPTTKSHTK